MLLGMDALLPMATESQGYNYGHGASCFLGLETLPILSKGRLATITGIPGRSGLLNHGIGTARPILMDLLHGYPSGKERLTLREDDDVYSSPTFLVNPSYPGWQDFVSLSIQLRVVFSQHP